jgi:hypothetical protein
VLDHKKSALIGRGMPAKKVSGNKTRKLYVNHVVSLPVPFEIPPNISPHPG